VISEFELSIKISSPVSGSELSTAVRTVASGVRCIRNPMVIPTVRTNVNKKIGDFIQAYLTRDNELYTYR
jgi:hypothetical protein